MIPVPSFVMRFGYNISIRALKKTVIYCRPIVMTKVLQRYNFTRQRLHEKRIFKTHETGTE